MVSFDELSPQYQSGIRNFYQMPSHILQFLANARQNDANYFLEIHIPSFQSVAGIASVMFVAYSNLASTKKYSTTNWLDGICISAQSVSIGISLICILLAGLTIATGITLIFKLASGVPDGFLRVLVTGYMNLEARTSIMRICGGRANIESMLSTKSSRRQQSRIMILSFKDCTKAEKAVTNLNNSLLEIGLNASLVTDLDILNAMKVGGVNGWTGNYDACEDFKKEAEAGENLVSSLVLETLHQVDSFYDPFSCTTAMIISLKNIMETDKIVKYINDEVVEFGGKACLVTNKRLLDALRTRENNGLARHLEYDNEFEKGVEDGENLVSSLVMEKLLKSKLESTKTMVEIRKWKVDLFIIFNAFILLTSAVAFLYAFFTIDSKSKGFTCIYLYGLFFGLVGVIVGFVGNAYKKKCNHPESIVMFVNTRELRRGETIMKNAGIQLIEVLEAENETILLAHSDNVDAKMMMERELRPEVGETGDVEVEFFRGSHLSTIVFLDLDNINDS